MTQPDGKERGLPPALSTYLDLLRVVAALWVMLSHFRVWGLAAPELAPLLPTAGHDAVIAFFVISGFVITHSQARKESSLGTYAADRATRIYSVVVPILLGTWLFAWVGSLLAPTLFADTYDIRKPWIYAPLHLLFLGEVWSLREVPVHNQPYWSLNYEVWYYVLFAILVFYRGARRLLLILAVFALLGLQHLAMWPTWLLGLALCRVIERWRMPAAIAGAVLVASVVVYAVIEKFTIDARLTEISTALYTGLLGHQPGNARQFLADYLMALIVAINILAFRWTGWRFPPRVARAIAWAAGYSFTLYLLHGPVLTVTKQLVGIAEPGLILSLALIAAMLATTILVGELTEKRRAAFRPPLARLIDRAGRLIAARPILGRLLAPAG